ncbi:MAG: SPOR domain-containing protein [Burkholderiales bacterium]
MTVQSSSKRGFAKARQRGGFAVGLIIGLLIGLALALGVALYVTKVPVPFINKVPQRTAGQDAAETEKNKNWDPNSPLYGKNPARAASGAVAEPVAPMALPASGALPVAKASAPVANPRDPAAILSGAAANASVAKAAAPAGADPFTYFVQAGAYGKTEDAEQQRARLAFMGMEAKLTEREQSGRTVFRVRLGPFDKKDDAEAAKSKLGDAGIEAALVRVQR